MRISHCILLRVRNISDKVVEKIKTLLMFSKFCRRSCRLWQKVEKCGTAREATDDNIIRRKHIACSISKATDTHSEYVILIAVPRQKWLRERCTMLRYSALPLLWNNCVQPTASWKPAVTQLPLNFLSFNGTQISLSHSQHHVTGPCSEPAVSISHRHT
jgi:hypothetical protein